MCTDQCVCIQTSVYVYRLVFMCTDQCLCAQTSVHVYSSVFMYKDQCLCMQTNVPQNVHLSVTSPRLYGGPQTNKTSNIKNKRQQNTSPCGI
jgi:hypothetical protein